MKASNSLFGNIYGDINTFLQVKKEEVQEIKHQTTFPDSVSSKFSLQAPALLCPIHDEETFQFFC